MENAKPSTSERQPGSRRLKPYIWAAVVILVAALFYVGTGYGYRNVLREPAAAGPAPADQPPTAARPVSPNTPTGKFIVIDRNENRLWLRDGDKVMLEAVVSAGAGSMLENPAKKEDWVFDTPCGRFTVVGKRKNPVWTAPDWEFIETKQPIPTNYGERVQTGMLGEYALDLNEPGYMIHGTLYTRLLGRNVSHGCIRVGRDDLRVLWKEVPVGTPVFIY